MNVNLAWRDAMQKASREFTREEINAGWQPAFESAQLAALQRFDGTHADRVNLWRQLVDDCERQTLNHEPNGHKEVIDNPGRWVTHTKGFRLDGTPVTERVVVGRTTKTVNLYRIAAADFAAWLAAQGETPSEHVAAWFDAVGVPQAGAIAPSALAVVLPTEPADLVLKKSALVDKNRQKWPTIEGDLSEASRNGLAAARVKHGHWNERIALEWADRNGKIRQPSSMSTLPSTVHRMKA